MPNRHYTIRVKLFSRLLISIYLFLGARIKNTGQVTNSRRASHKVFNFLQKV